MPRKPLWSAALLLVLALFAGACSDDDEKSANDETTTTEKSTTTTETPALTPEEIDTQASPYCATWAEIRGAGAPPSQDPEAVKKHYGDLLPSVERLLSQASAEIKPSVQVALDSTRTVATSGDLNDFQRPEVQDSQRKLSDYAVAHCKKK